MAAKKYSIGTRVVFMAHADMCYEAQQDNGKVGEVMGESSTGDAMVFLPDSVKNYGKKRTWYTNWKNVKPVLVKNQQLLFEFMSDG